MITDREAAQLISMAQLSGLDVPAAIAADFKGACRVWAALLNAAGVAFEDAMVAMTAYLSEPDLTQYRKPFPDPGKIIGRSSVGRAATALGGASDAGRAFVDFRARMAVLGFAPDRNDPRRHLDPRDPYRNDAMFAALQSVGGSRVWGGLDLSHPLALKDVQERWTAAYVAVRVQQRADREAVAMLAQQLAGSQQKQIGQRG